MSEEYLKEPEYGVMPPAGRFGYREKRTYEFEKILEKVKENPGRDACIARWKVTNDMGSKVCATRCTSAKASVWNYLIKYFPLENWMVFTRSTPGTWGDKELWCVYLGEMTPEEAMKLREMRKAGMYSDPRKTKKENAQMRLHNRDIYLDYQMQRRKEARG